MNTDNEEVVSAEGTRRSRRGVRWSSNLQNLRFELQSARAQIASLEEPGELDERDRAILDKCRQHLADAEKAFGRLLPRELFVWEMLFLIQQQLLLILPADELGAKWRLLEVRLKEDAEAARKCPCDEAYLDDIRQRLKDREQPGSEQDRDLRNRMVQVKKSLDDPVVVELWRNLQIRRYTVTFLVLGVLLTVALLTFIMVSPSFGMADGTIAKGGAHSAIGMMLAGAFGAVLSALAPGRPTFATGVPLLTVTSAVRPVIGAAAGLLLYLIHAADLLEIDGVGLYVLAVGLGFSERAFFCLLGGVAGKSDTAVGSRIV